MSIIQDKLDKLDNLDKEFNNAIESVKKLQNTPSSEELLKLYGLYKQANFGENTTDKPSMFNYRTFKKWLSWTAVSELTKDQAKGEYIKLVNYLIELEGN
jgi:diazepam-binding inhibitor (GABA receptor modulator, acyl-CoA-binding protein)